jgi:2-polyprenyl-6-methoxyphenol hydroxylase-like FAD-dependent oxidoreductase
VGRVPEEQTSTIALVGGGPSALVAAIALARRRVRTTIFERDRHPGAAPRFNPDRSYTIDISGHGLKAIRHIEAGPYFDRRMIPFKGLRLPDGRAAEWTLPGWTGSRGDILRALMDLLDEKYRPWVACEFETRVVAADVRTGELTLDSSTGGATRRVFDFVVGADGAGSVVRKAMVEQVPGFTVETGSHPNWCTMIELDRVENRLDPHYLHGLAVRPFCVAGAIKGDDGSAAPRWFCAVGTKEKQTFASADDARRYFRERVPRVLELTSDDKVAAFADRPCYHIGQTLRCSQLHGGKAALLGDAAEAFPPIGQGVNAAMESAITLDRCIGETGDDAAQLLEAARLYSERWKPEADAVAWMAIRSLFENRLHMLRASLAGKLGISIFEEAKSAEVPWSEVQRKAKRRWPLWI